MILLAANRQRRLVVMSGHVSLLLAFVPLIVAAAAPMGSLARQTSCLLTSNVASSPSCFEHISEL
jgi:hypothetical protein